MPLPLPLSRPLSLPLPLPVSLPLPLPLPMSRPLSLTLPLRAFALAPASPEEDMSILENLPITMHVEMAWDEGSNAPEDQLEHVCEYPEMTMVEGLSNAAKEQAEQMRRLNSTNLIVYTRKRKIRIDTEAMMPKNYVQNKVPKWAIGAQKYNKSLNGDQSLGKRESRSLRIYSPSNGRTKKRVVNRGRK